MRFVTVAEIGLIEYALQRLSIFTGPSNFVGRAREVEQSNDGFERGWMCVILGEMLLNVEENRARAQSCLKGAECLHGFASVVRIDTPTSMAQ